jgi:hypothetical protein
MCLECGDATIAWESELVDDLFYELEIAFKKRLAISLFPDLV